MKFKIGQRVQVLPGVSHCKDAGSLQTVKEGFSRDHFKGKKGEVVQIGKDGPVTCPPGYEECVLVDSQIVNGKPQGAVEMREWFSEDEVEPG